MDDDRYPKSQVEKPIIAQGKRPEETPPDCLLAKSLLLNGKLLRLILRHGA
jgi:hypothetical protein